MEWWFALNAYVTGFRTIKLLFVAIMLCAAVAGYSLDGASVVIHLHD